MFGIASLFIGKITMKSWLVQTRLVAATAGTIFVAQTSLAAIVLNDGGTTHLEVVVRDTNISMSNQHEHLYPTSLPFLADHTATQGNSNSQAQYDLNQERFVITSSGNRDGRIDSRTNVHTWVYFSVSADTPYRLTGTLTTVDPSAKYVEISATLKDVDSSTILFHNHQASFGVANESFDVGETEGNESNELSGSLTGVLLAGHRYELFHATALYASNSGSPASFNGAFKFSLVQEPTNEPPDCSNATASITTVWPPNNRFVTVNVVGVTDPDGDAVTINIDAIFQDEAVGSGNSAPDGKGIGTNTAQVRAERDGSGNGRVYHIFYTADDGNGGECEGEVTVCVPHDQGQGANCGDGGALYDSTGGP